MIGQLCRGVDEAISTRAKKTITMTKQQSLKQRIRARMKKTGERYTSARSHILKSLPSNSKKYPGLLPQYSQFGGTQTETAILTNSLRCLGLTLPETKKPYSESLLLGLCGGLGFLYAIFEYKGHLPILSLATRSQSMPQNFVMEGIKRLKIRHTVSTSSSAKVAQKALDESLAKGQPALCIIDPAFFPHYGIPSCLAGLYYHYVVVAGQDGDDYWIDDRSATPKRVSKEALAKARAGCKRAKHALASLQDQSPDFNLKAALNDALKTTVNALEKGEVGVPDSFKGNCGFAGLQKWIKLLGDARTKKGWLKAYPEGDRAWAVLRRSYECIQFDYTAPAASRPAYSDFLESAAELLDRPLLKKAAEQFRQSGQLWDELANTIANLEDKALARACEIINERAAILDSDKEDKDPSKTSMLDLWTEKDQLAKESKLSKDQSKALYGQMAAFLTKILEREQQAVSFLKED